MKRKLYPLDLGIVYKYCFQFQANLTEFPTSIPPLKSDSHLPKKIFICLIETPLKMMKNAIYFILKALFVLKIFEFLS